MSFGHLWQTNSIVFNKTIKFSILKVCQGLNTVVLRLKNCRGINNCTGNNCLRLVVFKFEDINFVPILKVFNVGGYDEHVPIIQF